MPASRATVETQHPGRYLTQLCTHASKMGRNRMHRSRGHADGGEPPEIQNAEWSATDGTITLNWGHWTMQAAPGTLMLRAEAGSEENLLRIQDLVTARLEKFGRRDHLAVNWQPAERQAAADLLPRDPARSPAGRLHGEIAGQADLGVRPLPTPQHRDLEQDQQHGVPGAGDAERGQQPDRGRACQFAGDRADLPAQPGGAPLVAVRTLGTCSRNVWRGAGDMATHRAVFDYIEGWYNTRRPYSSLGYLSPAEYESNHHNTSRQAA